MQALCFERNFSVLQEQHDWAKYVSIVSLVLFIMSFAIGPGSIPWFITAELFDQSARHYAVSIATLVNWAANFTSGLLFPIMQVILILFSNRDSLQEQ